MAYKQAAKGCTYNMQPKGTQGHPLNLMKKHLIALSLAILACAALPASAASTPLTEAAPGVPTADDLRVDARAAAKLGGAVLLVFVSDRCGYCEVVLNEFLIPMSRNIDYSQRIVMRRIVTNSDRPLRDFRGEILTHRRFAQTAGIRMTPVVQMFGVKGQLLGKPLVGLTTIDYYGHYLDQTIDRALDPVQAKLATPTVTAPTPARP